MHSYPVNRREFIRGAGSTLAAAVAANSFAPRAVAAPIEPMKAGVFGLDYSFWSIWANLLSPKGRGPGTSTLRLTPTTSGTRTQRKPRPSPRSGSAKWSTATMPCWASWTSC